MQTDGQWMSKAVRDHVYLFQWMIKWMIAMELHFSEGREKGRNEGVEGGRGKERNVYKNGVPIKWFSVRHFVWKPKDKK